MSKEQEKIWRGLPSLLKKSSSVPIEKPFI